MFSKYPDTHLLWEPAYQALHNQTCTLLNIILLNLIILFVCFATLLLWEPAYQPEPQIFQETMGCSVFQPVSLIRTAPPQSKAKPSHQALPNQTHAILNNPENHLQISWFISSMGTSLLQITLPEEKTIHQVVRDLFHLVLRPNCRLRRNRLLSTPTHLFPQRKCSAGVFSSETIGNQLEVMRSGTTKQSTKTKETIRGVFQNIKETIRGVFFRI